MPVCELCGHTEFVKQDGMFVCQGCGTKYSPEDAKKLPATPAAAAAATNADAQPIAEAAPKSAAEVVGGVAVAALGALIEALQKSGEFKPEEAGSHFEDVRELNNYICQGWQKTIDEYKRLEHPTKQQLDEIVVRAKESLQALENAALAEPEKYVQNTLIYGNCSEIVDSVVSLDCYEEKEGEWKRVAFPLNRSELKLAGQKDSWEAKRDNFKAQIEDEYKGANESDVALLAELGALADQAQAELDVLKDEKRSKGFFNFAEKGEVKERMKPVKEKLADIRNQIHTVERRISSYVDERIAELGKSFTILRF